MASKYSKESEDEFCDRVQNIVTSGFTTVAIAMGRHTGLFDIMAKFDEPKSIDEIAAAGNMKERYVAEWLKSLVVAHVIDLDQSGNRYYLPRHRRSALTTNGSKNYDTPFATALTMFMAGFFDVSECMKLDGPKGTPYSLYTKMDDITADFSGSWFKEDLTSSFLDTIPDVKSNLEKGINCIDICCGNGDAAIEIARAFPNSTVTGVDFSVSAIEQAKKLSKELGLKNCHFEVCDVASLPKEWSNKFDWVFMHDAFHDQAYPDKVLDEIYRIMTPGGRLTIVDTNAHTEVKDNLEKGHFHYDCRNYIFSLLHCMPVSLYFEGGMGLGTMWGKEKGVEMLTDHKFVDIQVLDVPNNEPMINFFCRKE